MKKIVQSAYNKDFLEEVDLKADAKPIWENLKMTRKQISDFIRDWVVNLSPLKHLLDGPDGPDGPLTRKLIEWTDTAHVLNKKSSELGKVLCDHRQSGFGTINQNIHVNPIELVKIANCPPLPFGTHTSS